MTAMPMAFRSMIRRRVRAGLALAAAAALGGCGTGLQSGAAGVDRAATTGSVGSPPAAALRQAAPIDMGGRWVLASPGGGFCHVNFGGGIGAAEGTIAPEGGCPANFYTSRKWNFEQNSLIIRNHLGEPLAQLAMSEPGRLEGRSTSGAPVSLTR